MNGILLKSTLIRLHFLLGQKISCAPAQNAKYTLSAIEWSTVHFRSLYGLSTLNNVTMLIWMALTSLSRYYRRFVCDAFFCFFGVFFFVLPQLHFTYYFHFSQWFDYFLKLFSVCISAPVLPTGREHFTSLCLCLCMCSFIYENFAFCLHLIQLFRWSITSLKWNVCYNATAMITHSDENTMQTLHAEAYLKWEEKNGTSQNRWAAKSFQN